MKVRAISPGVPHFDPSPATKRIINADGTKRRNLVWRAFFQIVFCLFVVSPAANATTSDGPSRTGDDLFAKANTEFKAGYFKAAITDYDAVVQSGEWSANLFYDLGNAYFRDSDFGHAILNYERALQLDRNHPEADANLRIARDQTHALELTPASSEKYLNFASAKSFTILAAILFWGTIILLILRRRKVLWMTIGLLLTVSCGLAVYKLENGTRGQGVAVVVADNTDARVATADSAKSVLVLPPGSEVVILQERGDWSYAALPNDLRGWISTKAVEKVRL
jgi:tetratricopeptide repeat protein